jgi:hypothetical protein
VALVPQRDDRYLRDPRLVPRDDGGAELHVIASEPRGESHLVIDLDPSGAPRGERTLALDGALLGFEQSTAPVRIARGIDVDRSATDLGWAVRVERDRGTSSVLVRRPGAARDVLVWRAEAIAAAPTIARARGGAWVAFHHDLREDTQEPDVIKWIAIRFVDDRGEVLEPVAAMCDRDRDREGEEQGFELPTIAVGAGGAIALFGRGSHRFWRQDLDDAQGFSARSPIGDDSGWGCRGRRITTCVLAGGGLLTARREKAGIVIERGALPAGGAPELRRCDVAVAPTSARRRDAPRRPTGEDPASRAGRRTLFGDIHQHSAHSDGCGVADEPYLRARWGYGDDFCALTDHESFLGKRIERGEWDYLQRIAEDHDEPGTFATLIAYEWTGRRYPGPGHKVVYLPGPGAAIVSRDHVPEGRALIEAVTAQGGFAVPHHVGWTGADEDAHDPIGQPVWEICSCHGCYLHADHELGARGDLRDQMVEDVLRRGLRFGFIACSDGHGLLWHHGVARKRDPFRTGLTAVQATECTRAAIIEAIRARRCYATSGAPIWLDLVADGEHPMGSEIAARGPVRLEARARGASAIREISLVASAGRLAVASGRADPGDDAACAATVHAEIEHGWVYARVVQEDGEMAWSSPIFVDRVS